MRNQSVRKRWNRQAESWDEHVWSSDSFLQIQDAVIGAARPGAADRCVDLGAGSGFLTWPLAEKSEHVTAVDIAHEMGQLMLSEATSRGADNVEVVICALQDFDLEAGSVDVVASSYALHHLTDAEKVALLARTRRWLRPGGRVVIADMMFGRGGTAQDRRILVSKAGQLLKKGPGGVWRLVKNITRFGLRLGTERPAPPSFWTAALVQAGFEGVEYTSILGEAGLVVGRIPQAGDAGEDGSDDRAGQAPG